MSYSFTPLSPRCKQDIYKSLINSVEDAKKAYSDKVHGLLLKNNNSRNKSTTTTTTTTIPTATPTTIDNVRKSGTNSLHPVSAENLAYLVKKQMMSNLTSET